MLISPLMTPIVGLGFGLAIFDTRLIKQSLKVLFTQVSVSYTHLDVYKSQLFILDNDLLAASSQSNFKRCLVVF